VTNKPDESRLRQQVLRDGQQRTDGLQQRKGLGVAVALAPGLSAGQAASVRCPGWGDDPMKGRQPLPDPREQGSAPGQRADRLAALRLIGQ
jgi:hypothetical protein